MAATSMTAEGVPVEEPIPLPRPTDGSGSDAGSAEEADLVDDTALLLRHTRVRVVGNNRTKASLVGKEGVVKKAVGLGGWHWLVLESGEEVKLQRNALEVVAYPTGLEQDFSDVEDSVPAAQEQEQLPKVRSRRPPRPLGIASPDGLGVHEQRRKSHRSSSGAQSKLDFGKVSPELLKRYKRHYRLADAGPTKESLVRAVTTHFVNQTVDERAVLDAFLIAVRRAGCHTSSDYTYQIPAPAWTALHAGRQEWGAVAHSIFSRDACEGRTAAKT